MFVGVAHIAAGVAAALALSTSAVAFQTPESAQEQPEKGTSSAKQERRCETITVTGSRLAKKKFCGTREEWAEKRLQDRQATERVQTQLCVYSKTGATGRPSC
jgi:hypothetical protein